MPYVFPHEDIFVAGVAILIVGLLVYRIAIARARKRSGHGDQHSHNR